MRNTTAHAAALEASYLVPRSVIRDSCTTGSTKLKQLSLASVAIWKEATAQSLVLNFRFPLGFSDLLSNNPRPAHTAHTLL